MQCIGSFGKGWTRELFIFVDETGDLKFRVGCSRYYVLTAFWTYHPICIASSFTRLRYQFLRRAQDIPEFHANINTHPVRVAVLDCLSQHRCAKAASIIVQKNKVNPSIQDKAEFYPKFLGMLLKGVVGQEFFRGYSKAIVIADEAPTKEIGKAVRRTSAQSLSVHVPHGCTTHVFQHPSVSNSCIQAADYCGWAINRDWTQRDKYFRTKVDHFYDRPELDVLRRGTTVYY